MAGWETEPAAVEPASNGDTWGAAAATADDTSAPKKDAWGATEETTEEPAVQHITKTLEKTELVAKARNAGWNETTAFDYDEFQRTGGNDADWHGRATVYEWQDDYGDVGPRVPELENILFGGEYLMRKGEHMQFLKYEVQHEGPKKIDPISSFDNAGLHPVVLQNVELAQYHEPTVIQAYTIPAVLQGSDVVGVAQTGSGKTAAYLIPVISRLMGKAKKLCAPKPRGMASGLRPNPAAPLVVIVVPTRELAIQVFDEARRMCYRSMLRPGVAYGGLPMQITAEELRKGCDVLIATPGRLCALMNKPDLLTMSRVKYTIIDEADEMLNSDWDEELTMIMSGGDTNEDADHIYLMFSATFPKGARALAAEYMSKEHFRIRVGRPGSSHKNIRQNVIFVDQNMKKQALYDLLFQSEVGRTIIFCNSKPTVDLVDDYLYNLGLPTTSIHSDRNQREREDALRAFRTGKCPILIATGVSARGWDIKDVKHVINYDLPSGMYGGINEYIHRIGRTARIGHQGLATSFYNDRNEDIQQDLVNILTECDCEVPEFLSHLKPEDGAIDFGDDTDDEADDEAGAGFGAAAPADTGASAAAAAWGAPEGAADGGAPVAAGWGAAPEADAAAASAW